MKHVFALTLLLSLPAFAGIVEPLMTWKKATVSVCFANSQNDLKDQVQKDRTLGLKFYAFTDQEKDLIIRTIEHSYSTSLTGIHFTTWKNCDANEPTDAILAKTRKIYFLGLEVAGPTFLGESSIGQDGDSAHNYETLTGKTPLIIFNDFSETTIAHEFGHLAGLRHEHIHPDASKDQKCLKRFKLSEKSYNSYFSKSTDRFYPHTLTKTAYDPYSIMNYCSLQDNDLRDGLLSDLDRYTLKETYAEFLLQK